MSKQLILEVRYNKANDHKYVTIPKHRDIVPGDYVRIIKIGSGDGEIVKSVDDVAPPAVPGAVIECGDCGQRKFENDRCPHCGSDPSNEEETNAPTAAVANVNCPKCDSTTRSKKDDNICIHCGYDFSVVPAPQDGED